MVNTDLLGQEFAKVILVVSIVYLLFMVGSVLTPGFGLPGDEPPDRNESIPENATDAPVETNEYAAAGVNGTVVDVSNTSTMDVRVDGEISTVRVAGVVTPSESASTVNTSQFQGVPESAESRACLAEVGVAGGEFVRERFAGEDVVVVPVGGERVDTEDVSVGYVYLRSDTSVSASSVIIENGFGFVGKVPRPRGVDSAGASNLNAEFELLAVSAESDGVGIWGC